MIEGKEKTTVPIPSVGADGEQPISNYYTSIISADSNEINPQFPMLEDDFAEIQRRIARMNDPSYWGANDYAERASKENQQLRSELKDYGIIRKFLGPDKTDELIQLAKNAEVVKRQRRSYDRGR